MPFGATSVALLLTVAFASVIFGVGLPVGASCDFVNSTTVFGAFALLDHKFPLPSIASAHGAWIDPEPLSLSVTAGVSAELVGVVVDGFTTGRLDALN